MSTQRVPLEVLQKIRQHLRSALVVPESENHPNLYNNMDEPPKPDSLEELGSLFHFGSSLDETLQMPNNQGRWFISATNPGAVLVTLPSIKLKPDFRLVTYLFRLGEDGKGVTWALPESCSTTSHLEKALLTASGRDNPPQPEGALADCMDAIDGDHSPRSFVIASLLRRELRELGKMGKVADWVHHRLIDALPDSANWQWRTEPPKDFSPKVRVSEGRAAIEFFTCRVTAPIVIFQHVDQYVVGQYQAKHLDRPLAINRTPALNGKKPI
ncbi:hypothetical protein Q2T42_01475 [Leptolyngbya boryana CZ1]|uniref:Uncharacterized protein n=1 Tax=Leptolyngbya boryana CZ1 TaxID=3060204 RepID=A0AA96X6J3_LEPBY|nr:hypothetical protein [Leptolyngbya boryana]WNZ46505.1 hypothetical protein Q2T42_01475 [Leptolyngbya boryana CZ1]